MASKTEPRPADAPLACIILAAGRGTRMRARKLPKVCFPVVGVPVINRSIAAYRACGAGTIVVVVGEDGGEVIETVTSEFDGVLFARQPSPLGTGDAVRAGFEPLQRLGFEGNVICAVGDKLIREEAVRRLLAEFERERADAALAVTERPDVHHMGRTLLDDKGEVEGIVEERDLRAAELCGRMDRMCRRARGRLDVRALRAACLAALGSEEICERFLRQAWKRIARTDRVSASALQAALPARPGFIQLAGRWEPAAAVRRAPAYMNESLYVFRAPVLARAMPLLKQRRHGEVYFTDIVQACRIAAKRDRRAKVIPVFLANRDWLQGYNTPDQLLDIEEKTRVRVRGPQKVARTTLALGRRLLRPAGTWLRLIDDFPPRVRRQFREVYGGDRALLAEKRQELLAPLRRFCRMYGPDRKAVIARAPGTVNLMGRHVDVVGGSINVASIDREVWVVAAPRDDDLVRLSPLGGGRRARAEFAIGREIASLGWDDWLTYISLNRVREMVTRARGDWGSIARAAAVRLQQHSKTRRLRGMDAVAQSGIPLAAGLGASSAMLVALSEAIVSLNGLEMSPHQFVLLCGEGEWYFGSRGTAAQHAAMKLGRRGQVAHLRFFPFEAERLIPFPDDWRLVLGRAPAPRGGGSDGTVRARSLAAMQSGLLLLRTKHPHLGYFMEHVRDLSPKRLGVTLRELYAMLLDLPRSATPARLRRLLSGENARRLEALIAPLGERRSLPVRDALCFGAAECARGDLMARLLARAEGAQVGTLLSASHDAERAVCRNPAGGAAPFRWSATDARLTRCMSDLQSDDPERARRARIELQPGRFGPGSADIDAMVDVAETVPGVLGAQISGAPAGGCAMMIAREDAVDPLRRALRQGFYRPRRLRDRSSVCSFVAGAGVLEI